jgi:hypothetical protein
VVGVGEGVRVLGCPGRVSHAAWLQARPVLTPAPPGVMLSMYRCCGTPGRGTGEAAGGHRPGA